MKKYLLFDLDGTLTDPKVGICTCVQYALASFGIEEPDLDKLEPFIGPPLKDSFRNFYNFTEEQAEAAVEKYRERFAEIGIFENKVYDGIVPMLNALNGKGMYLAVASSKPQVYVERILQHFNIARYFSVIVGSELDGSRVNKDEVVEEALRRLFRDQPVQRDQVYMIGDRSFDAEGARKAHVESVGVTYGYGSMEELKAAKADYIVRSVEELQQFLLRGTEDAQKLTPTQRIWQIFLPLLLFIFVKNIGVNLSGVLLQTIGDTIPVGEFLFIHDETGRLVALTGNSATLMEIIGFIAGTVAIKKIATRTIPKGAEAMKLSHIKGDSVQSYIFLGLACVGAAVGLNLFLSLSGLVEASATYQAVSETQYSSHFVMGLICFGLVAPVAEEILFRGVIYNCLRRNMPVLRSVLMSSIIFGLYHMNAVQGVYAFLIGCIISYAFEYFGKFAVPVAIHMLINILVYCLSYVTAAVTGFVSWPVCAVFLCMAAVGLFMMNREKKIFV